MAVTQYIGAAYLAHGWTTWDAQTSYDNMYVVEYQNGNYISKKNVPPGVSPAGNQGDNEYWAWFGVKSKQIEEYRQEVNNVLNELNNTNNEVNNVLNELNNTNNTVNEINNNKPDYTQTTDLSLLNLPQAFSLTPKSGYKVQSIAIDATGNMYIAATQNETYTITKYDNNGNFLKENNIGTGHANSMCIYNSKIYVCNYTNNTEIDVVDISSLELEKKITAPFPIRGFGVYPLFNNRTILAFQHYSSGDIAIYMLHNNTYTYLKTLKVPKTLSYRNGIKIFYLAGVTPVIAYNIARFSTDLPTRKGNLIDIFNINNGELVKIKINIQDEIQDVERFGSNFYCVNYKGDVFVGPLPVLNPSATMALLENDSSNFIEGTYLRNSNMTNNGDDTFYEVNGHKILNVAYIPFSTMYPALLTLFYNNRCYSTMFSIGDSGQARRATIVITQTLTRKILILSLTYARTGNQNFISLAGFNATIIGESVTNYLSIDEYIAAVNVDSSIGILSDVVMSSIYQLGSHPHIITSLL